MSRRECVIRSTLREKWRRPVTCKMRLSETVSCLVLLCTFETKGTVIERRVRQESSHCLEWGSRHHVQRITRYVQSVVDGCWSLWTRGGRVTDSWSAVFTLVVGWLFTLDTGIWETVLELGNICRFTCDIPFLRHLSALNWHLAAKDSSKHHCPSQIVIQIPQVMN